MELATRRLRMRPWQESDREPFAALNADPEVMAFFPAPLSRAKSDASIDAWQAQFAERGWSNWALELADSGQFIGYTGLSVPVRVLPFTPCVEIGWRLPRFAWGHGYATEAAREALRFGFEVLGLPEIVSFTTHLNIRSRAVMERIGMRDTQQDFLYPSIPADHPHQPFTLYRITRDRWAEAAA